MTNEARARMRLALSLLIQAETAAPLALAAGELVQRRHEFAQAMDAYIEIRVIDLLEKAARLEYVMVMP